MLSMINHKLNIQDLAARFNIEHRLQIRDFLSKKFANEVLKDLEWLNKKQLWKADRFGNPRFYNPNERAGFSQGYGAYSYDSFPLVDLGKTRSPAVRTQLSALVKLLRFLHSKECFHFISKATGLEITKNAGEFFASCYRPGDFCSLHDDFGNGRQVTFVLNLTKDWVVHWGGCLVFLNNSADQITHTVTPEFNSLSLFRVPLPHAVLPVSNYSQQPRYAVSGWFL